VVGSSAPTPPLVTHGTVSSFDAINGCGYLAAIERGHELDRRNTRLPFSLSVCAVGFCPRANDPVVWEQAGTGRGTVTAVRPVLVSASDGNRLCSLCRDGDWAAALAVVHRVPSAAGFSRRGLLPLQYMLSCRRDSARWNGSGYESDLMRGRSQQRAQRAMEHVPSAAWGGAPELAAALLDAYPAAAASLMPLLDAVAVGTPPVERPLVGVAVQNGAPTAIIRLLLQAWPDGFDLCMSKMPHLLAVPTSPQGRTVHDEGLRRDTEELLHLWRSGVPQARLLLGARQRLALALGATSGRAGRASQLTTIVEPEFVHAIAAAIPRLASEVVFAREST
jgi:hypothetical protein